MGINTARSGDAQATEPWNPQDELLAVFGLRCEVRAKLSQLGALSLHDAVDVLQADAERDGIIAAIGQDAVQAIIAAALGAVRDDVAADDDAPADDGDEYEGLSSTFAAGCRAADERQRQRLAGQKPRRSRAIAISTLRAAQFLIQQNDTGRFQRWLDKHTPEQRAAIRQFLGRRTTCHSHKNR
jgi:hypothetical protein